MKNIWPWILVLVIVLGALFWWYQAQAPEVVVPSEEVAGEDAAFEDGSKDGAADTSGGTSVSAFTVRYTTDGFSPETLEVPVGATVTFINQGGPDMWVGSDEHPSHTQYAGTSKDQHCVNSQPSTTAFDQCAIGASYTFTFTKEGSWKYHNHRDSSHRGTIVVE